MEYRMPIGPSCRGVLQPKVLEVSNPPNSIMFGLGKAGGGAQTGPLPEVRDGSRFMNQ